MVVKIFFVMIDQMVKILWCEKCYAEGPYADNIGVAQKLWNTRSTQESECGDEEDLYYVIYKSDDGVTVEVYFEDELMECFDKDWFDDDFEIMEDIGDAMNMCDMAKGTMIIVKGEIVNPLREE